MRRGADRGPKGGSAEMKFVINSMVYIGAALMVYNICGFIRFARAVKMQKSWKRDNVILHVPIVFLVLFLLGYLAVGIAGHPDLIVAGILFGGSIFVYIMYWMLNGIVKEIIDGEHLEAQLSAAEDSNRAKASFLASVSHEMRTPINLILGLNGLARKDPDLKPETATQLEKVDANARQLLRLVNNVLDMNSVETGTIILKHETFRLSELIDMVDQEAREDCAAKGLTYVFSMQEGLEGSYTGDVQHLKMILLSMLDNAVKFTDAPGTVRLYVESASEEEGKRTLTFTVSDTGVGIEKVFLPYVFDLFTQEDASSTNRFGGCGLSLAITKRVVELMGGTITVESEKGVGSAFCVSVPLEWEAQTEESSEEPAAPSETAEELPEDPASLEGKRVLIVEDILDNAEIVQDLLELEGAESEHAGNGQIAVDMFSQNAPNYYDAILMDLRMPVMDGLEAARRIRALDRPDAKTVPIVALTANAFESDMRQTRDAGMDAHLAKPADSNLLYSTLGRLILRAQNTAEEGRK